MLLRLTVDEDERVSQSLLAGPTQDHGGLQEESTDHTIYMEDKARFALWNVRLDRG